MPSEFDLSEVLESLGRVEELRENASRMDARTPDVDLALVRTILQRVACSLEPLFSRLVAAGGIDVLCGADVYHPVAVEVRDGEPIALRVDNPCCGVDHAVDAGPWDARPEPSAQIEQHVSFSLRADLLTLLVLSRHADADDVERLRALRSKVLPVAAQLVDAFVRAGLLAFVYADRNRRSVVFEADGTRIASGKIVLSGKVAHVDSPAPRLSLAS